LRDGVEGKQEIKILAKNISTDAPIQVSATVATPGNKKSFSLTKVLGSVLAVVGIKKFADKQEAVGSSLLLAGYNLWGMDDNKKLKDLAQKNTESQITYYQLGTEALKKKSGISEMEIKDSTTTNVATTNVATSTKMASTPVNTELVKKKVFMPKAFSLSENAVEEADGLLKELPLTGTEVVMFNITTPEEAHAIKAVYIIIDGTDSIIKSNTLIKETEDGRKYKIIEWKPIILSPGQHKVQYAGILENGQKTPALEFTLHVPQRG